MSPPAEPGDPAAATAAVSALAARARDAEDALRRIAGIASAAFRADGASVALVNPDSGRLEVEARAGPPADAADPFFESGQGLQGWAALHGRPALAPDTGADPRYRAERPGVRSQMAAPLAAADGQVLGVLAVDRDSPPAFGAGDLDALAGLASEASLVMQRLWQLGHLTEKARQLESLLNTGRALVGQLEPLELAWTLARETRLVMRARACAFYTLDPDASTLRIAAFAGDDVGPPQGGDLPLESCLVAPAIRTRRPVAFPDIQSPEYRDLVDLPGDASLRSALTVPVSREGDVLGALAIFLDRVRRFDNDEKRLCSTLAGLGAVALQNARLYARVFQSEESLRKNERLTTLGLLAAEIAHEIRNPLTVVKLLHGGLGRDLSPVDPRLTDLRVIGEKLDQLEALVSRVLSFARAPASLHTRCAFVEIVEDTLVLVRLKLAQSKVRLRFSPPPFPVVIEGHKGQLQQVLLNLLINALQAMPEGGTITLTLGIDNRGQAPTAVLDVADTGAGMPDDVRDRLFDSFLSGRPGGTGLGLSIAKRVLLGHHGDIVLLSTGLGGTTFRVTLPLAKG
jgi:signal transduction histidine kinase